MDGQNLLPDPTPWQPGPDKDPRHASGATAFLAPGPQWLPQPPPYNPYLPLGGYYYVR